MSRCCLGRGNRLLQRTSTALLLIKAASKSCAMGELNA